MKFSEIYNLVIPYWGNEIDISDYKSQEVLYSLSKGKKRQGYSKSSQNLSRKWREVESVIGSNNPYVDLMVWTMFQIFHKVSEGLFIGESFKLFPKEVDKKLIEQQYFKNLQPEDWKEELAGYVNDIS